MKKDKIIAIVGTTASGKTSLAVDLADKFNGEVVSADSRQVYKYLDIGSGKDLPEYKKVLANGEIKSIPYHLIDVADPNEIYDLAKWLKAASIATQDIIDRQKLPIIAGGTGLFTQALIDGYQLSQTKADDKLRGQLEKFDKAKLFEQLLEIDNNFASGLNNSERNNKRRLIRHIEILSNKHNEVENLISKQENPYDALMLGIKWPKEVLRERIMLRLTNRLEKENMLGEVRDLHELRNVSWERLESFGLEYKFLARHLQGKLTYDDMVEKLHTATCQFAKKQRSWLKRWETQGVRINWVSSFSEAEPIVINFFK